MMKPILLAAAAFTLAGLALPGLALPAKAQAPSFAGCLAIDDMTKERLDCFDKIIRPEAIQVMQPTAPKRIEDCRYLREQDARLRCFDRFAETPAAPAKRKGK